MTSTQPGDCFAPERSAAQPTSPGAQPVSDSVTQPEHVAPLVGLENRPLAEHADVFEQVHSALQAALSDIDNA